jgi:LysM repeat protein
MDRKRLTILGLFVICFLAIISAAILFITGVDFSENEGFEGLGLTRLVLVESLIESGASQALGSGSIVAAVTATTTGSINHVEQKTSELDAIRHTVQFEENLFQISVRYGVLMELIMEANEIFDPRMISAGQVLIIPVGLDLPHSSPIVDVGSDPQNTPTTIQEATATPTATSTATPEATPLPAPPSVLNGVSLDSIIVMPPNVRENIREIYARGQEFELNPRAYSKVGDSTIENPYFLGRFDEGPYNLGEFSYLQTVVDYYAGSHARQGQAVRVGFHSWTVTDPLWADKAVCIPNETPVACEIRLHRPSIIIIRLGSNDAGVPGSFDFNVRQVVEYAIQQGVIPVIGTKADRFEGPGNVNNNILRQIAADFQIPLWDFDAIAVTIPGRGLDIDNVHLTTFYAHDYTSPMAFQRGHGVHNLTALMVLDAVWREVKP